MTIRLEFWYEFASTYSYPAAMRAEEVAADRGIEIAWRPFLLGPILADLGWTTSPFNVQPAKGAYMWRDLERICAALDLAFHKPTPFPQNGLWAARVAQALPDNGQRASFSKAVYHAEFARSQTISEQTVLETVLRELGHSPKKTLQEAASKANKEALRTQTEYAQRIGVFGAPTWRTADGELFWGNDRLEDALHWAQKAAG